MGFVVWLRMGILEVVSATVFGFWFLVFGFWFLVFGNYSIKNRIVFDAAFLMDT